MKNATATSHGSSRLEFFEGGTIDRPDGVIAGFELRRI
jgi:hypothetical protein